MTYLLAPTHTAPADTFIVAGMSNPTAPYLARAAAGDPAAIAHLALAGIVPHYPLENPDDRICGATWVRQADGSFTETAIGTAEAIAAALAAQAQANLASARTEADTRRIAARVAAETGGFTHAGKRIQSDRDSLLRIAIASGTASTAIMTETPWSTSWRCADDSDLALDAPGMLAMQADLAAHGQACHTRSCAISAEIAAAADIAALAAIDMSTGWPGPQAPA